MKHIPPPMGEPDGILQFQVGNLDYSDYLGRIAIGRVVQGTVKEAERVAVIGAEKTTEAKIAVLYNYEGQSLGSSQQPGNLPESLIADVAAGEYAIRVYPSIGRSPQPYEIRWRIAP